MNFEAHHGDCLDILKTLPDNSVDSIVTDPPYGLSFMGRKWDYDVPSTDIWAECLRVLKPGGHLLAFAGTRTQHRMAVRIEDAGFEIRDMIAWVYGSGFNKIGYIRNRDGSHALPGFGGSLKPALEPITMARKPFKGTVADNVLAHGTGALNIDGCRVDFASVTDEAISKSKNQHANFDSGPRMGNNVYGTDLSDRPNYNRPGRWPANLIHDGSDEVVAGFPVTSSGALKPWVNKSIAKETVASFSRGLDGALRNYTAEANTGSAARFFYCAKASKRDRDEGLGHLPEKASTSYGEFSGTSTHAPKGAHNTRANHHPTVKPTDLMRFLVRLVTPPGGTVLDPFMGSGSTGKAAVLEGFRFIGCEREAEYLAIANARIAHALQRTEAESQPGPLFA